MNDNWKVEFQKHYEFMLSNYGASPFDPKDFYKLVYDTTIFIIQPLNFSYLNFYLTTKKIQFDKNVLEEVINKWTDSYLPKLSWQGKLFLETQLLVFLGFYARNEYILKDTSKIITRSFKKKQIIEKIDYEWTRAIKNLPYLVTIPDNQRQLRLEYYHLLHGNRGLSIRTIGFERHTLEWIQKTTKVSKSRIFDLFILCYLEMKFIEKSCSTKTIEKRIERLNSDFFKKRINRLVELEKLLFPLDKPSDTIP